MIVRASINSVSVAMGRYTARVSFGPNELVIFIDPPASSTENGVMLDLADVGRLRLLVREFTDDGATVRELPLYAPEERER